PTRAKAPPRAAIGRPGAHEGAAGSPGTAPQRGHEPRLDAATLLPGRAPFPGSSIGRASGCLPEGCWFESNPGSKKSTANTGLFSRTDSGRAQVGTGFWYLAVHAAEPVTTNTGAVNGSS